MIALRTTPTGLAVADLDDDGDADVVAAVEIFPDPIVAVFLADGGGGALVLEPEIAFAGAPRAVEIADVTGDGILDVVVVSGGSTDPHLAILAGNGDGTFDDPLRYALAAEGRDLSIADLDEDGFLDIVVTTQNSVTVLRSIAALFGE